MGPFKNKHLKQITKSNFSKELSNTFEIEITMSIGRDSKLDYFHIISHYDCHYKITL